MFLRSVVQAVVPPLHPFNSSDEVKILKAANTGNRDLVEELLKNNPALINATDKSALTSPFYAYTPLMHAARQGHVDVVRLLLAQKDLNLLAQTGAYNTPLHWAIYNQHHEVIELLLSALQQHNCLHGLYIQESENDFSPLHAAIKNNDFSTVKLLLDAAPDAKRLLSLRTKEGKNAFQLAYDNNYFDIASYIEFFAGDRSYYSLLEQFVQHQKERKQSRSRLSIATESLSAKDQKLYSAASQGNEAVLLEALKEGANPNVRAVGIYEGNYTPLIIASKNGHAPIVDILLQHQADPCLRSYIDDTGNSPLHWAAINGHVDVVKRLVEANPEPLRMKEYEKGYTPLHAAAAKGHADICFYLAHLYPDLLNETAKGPFITPIHAACAEHPQLAKSLLDFQMRKQCVDSLMKQVIDYVATEKEFESSDRLIEGLKKFQDDENKLPLACALLNLDVDAFNQLPLLKNKQEYLAYLFLKMEFNLLSLTSEGMISTESCDTLLQLLEDAYQTILTSDLITQHQDNDVPFGLSELDTFAKSNVPACYQHLEMIDPNLIILKKKESGVEPGYIVAECKDIFLMLHHQLPDASARRDYWHVHHFDLHRVYRDIAKDLPTYMIKLTFANVTNDNKVIPDRRNLQQTAAIQSIVQQPLIGGLAGEVATTIYKKSKTCGIDEKLLDAVKELAANDIAGEYGMSVQEQVARKRHHKKGQIKLTLKGKMIPNAAELKPVGGGLARHDNYRVRAVITPQDGITHLSDNSVDVYRHYPAFIAMRDYDGLGSKLQNKLYVGKDLKVIDCGHAWEIPLGLTDDFRIINQPKFKNYTLFYDAPRHDYIKGLFTLARINNKKIDAEVVDSYGEGEALVDGKKNADKKVFRAYICKLEEMAASYESDEGSNQYNKTCLLNAAKSMREVKKEAIQSRKELVKRFEQYLLIPKEAVDLVENIEKFVAGKEQTTLRSNNGKVLLNHLLIKENVIQHWDFTVDSDEYCFAASFSSPELAKKAMVTINEWLEQSPSNDGLVQLSCETNQIILRFPKKNLRELDEQFNENKLKSHFHPDDFALYLHYQTEMALRDKLKTLAEKGVVATISAHPCMKNYYKISLTASFDLSNFLDVCSHHQLRVITEEGQPIIICSKQELNEMDEKFSRLLAAEWDGGLRKCLI